MFTNYDGAHPSAGLALAGNRLYGTTQSGGSGGTGTIFAIDPDGAGFTNLYNFTPLAYNEELFANTNLEGANPYAGVLLVDDYLYGTTCNGGSGGLGSIFALSLIPGAPLLDIQIENDTAVISWPACETGATIQQCADLAARDWRPCTAPINDDGDTKSVRVPLTSQLFFRLVK